MRVCNEGGQRTASQPMTKCQVHVASSCSAALMLSAACDACARGSGCQRQASVTAYSRHGPAARAGKTIMSYVAITPASFSDFRLWGHHCLQGQLPLHSADKPLQPHNMLRCRNEQTLGVGLRFAAIGAERAHQHGAPVVAAQVAVGGAVAQRLHHQVLGLLHAGARALQRGPVAQDQLLLLRAGLLLQAPAHASPTGAPA